MRHHRVDNLDALKSLLATFGDDVLFRGQVKEYGPPDAPIINTSFDRNGCIPPLMLRWSYYARFALAALLQRAHADISIEFMQAVLQHYGFRSFYVDVSASPAVAAWFASHQFSMRTAIEMCEDCFEDGVFLVKSPAKYAFVEGDGHLYVLSKRSVADANLSTFDLSAIAIDKCLPRYIPQQAWLIGVLHGALPGACILESITAPRSVLRDFAAESGLKTTSDLFPSVRDDPVLDVLISLPWHVAPEGRDKKNPLSLETMEFFRPALALPEYEDSFEKHLPPRVALYRGTKASENVQEAGLTFHHVSPDVMFGSADVSKPVFPTVLRHVREKGRVVYEIPLLVRKPENIRSDEYAKGLAVEMRGDIIAVADFMVDHPGQQMTSVGINFAWHYRVAPDGEWIRQADAADCGCSFPWRHEHHLSVLAMIEDGFTKRRAALRGQHPAHGTS
jgi:hypothetical protein